MKSEKTLDDTAYMDSMFTMSIHTPRWYILELLLIQSAHTFWEAQRHNTKINEALKCKTLCACMQCRIFSAININIKRALLKLMRVKN